MREGHDGLVLDLLCRQGLVSDEAVVALKNEEPKAGRSLSDFVVQQKWLSQRELLNEVASAIGATFVAELPGSIPAELTKLVPTNLARKYQVVPLRAELGTLDLLAVEPLNPGLAEELTFALGRQVRLLVGAPAAVRALIMRYYGADVGLNEVADESGAATESARAEEAKFSTNDLEALASQAPVVRFVNLVLGQAIRDHASDIHFEPFESEFKIRYRIDGVLYEMAPPSPVLALPITSRLKVLANLNIAERRLPQDGRIRLAFEGKRIDLRVSTLPTQFGESVVLRVLDQSNVGLELTQLGMPEGVLRGVERTVRRPNGILIVTGPTGSGKTTTLYSALRLISTPDLKVLTAEDPVEYELDGIMQVPVFPAAGLTFASALRAFLRQDPDVIMVGEIRDLETAQIAIQAALTGHLVLSTLHTNDAAGAVTRLVDMGVEPYLIASTVEAVLAQRLVRKICSDCRRAFAPDERRLTELGLDCAAVAGRKFYSGAGCGRCSGTGYRGRTGIYEWLPMTEACRTALLADSSAFGLRHQAVSQGMVTLREAGWRAVFDGETTIDEILRCT